MYNRYDDISKFVTDIDQLKVADDEIVYISSEYDYDIAIDLDGCYDTFEHLKQFMAIIAEHVCEMDNTVLKFINTTRRNDKPLKFARLPSSYGTLRYDYAKSMEKEPIPKEKNFPYELEVIYITKPNIVTFDYWAANKNDQCDVTFEYKEGKFFLRTFGMYDCIPDYWDEG